MWRIGLKGTYSINMGNTPAFLTRYKQRLQQSRGLSILMGLPRAKAYYLLRNDFRNFLLTSAATILLFSSVASAQKTPREIDLNAQTADQSLLKVAQEFGIQIFFAPNVIKKFHTAKVKGLLTVQEALIQLLRETDLKFQFTDQKTVIVSLKNPPKTIAQPLRNNKEQSKRKIQKQRFESIAHAGYGGDLGDKAWGTNSDTIEEVIVTGTRVDRSTLTTPIPLTVFGRADIVSAGHNELSDILLEIPSITSSFNTQNGQLLTHSSGLSVISMRGLGSNRTLVLVDGRRTISNSPIASRVGLATIPTGFIERVEVITGGASAVYGSQAIAGVVNIITRKNIEGFNITTSGGYSPESGGEEITLSFTGGLKTKDGRGSFSFNVTYDDEAGLMAEDRDFALTSVKFDDAQNSLIAPSPSNSIPGGRFEGERFFFDDEGLKTDFNLATDGYEFRALQTLMIPRDRILGAVNSRYEISSGLEAFLNMQYSSINTRSTRAPDTVRDSQVGEIPLDNPFIPDAIRADAIDRNQTGLSFRRRLIEVGRRGRSVKRDTFRLWGGLQGEVSDSLNWQIHYGWGLFEQEQSRFNDIIKPRFSQALSVEIDPQKPGSFRCKDAAARAEGCVPINIFGVGTISSEAKNYVRLQDSLEATLVQHVASTSLSGNIDGLSAGAINFAAGLEYRRETNDVAVDEFTSSGQSSLTNVPNINGTFEAFEGFGELVVPILANKPLMHYLGFEGALRIANYSIQNVGTVWSYKLGANWTPIADFRLRAQWSRAQRAPDISEFLSPPRGDFDDVDDPCNNVSKASTGTIAANCLSIPEIAAAVVDEGSFVQETRNIFSPNGGNFNLREEVADTFTAGIVLTPNFLPGLSFAADYYDIKIKDAIDAIDSQIMLDQCYGDTHSFPDNIFCREIQRNNTGQLLQIDNNEQNLTSLRASGVDISLGYLFSLDDLTAIPGAFSLRLLYSNIIKLEERFDGILTTPIINDSRGEVGNPVHRSRASLTWNNDRWRIRWRTLYTGAVVDSNQRAVNFKVRGVNKPLFLEIGDEWVHNVHIQYRMTENKDMTLFSGVNNIFNNMGPFLPDGTVSGGTNNFASEYGSVGRFVYGGIAIKF